MAEETRTENGQFGRLDQVKDQATYNRVRAAQIAGKDEEEDDDEPAEEATGKEETQREYKEKREKKQGGGAQKKIDKLTKRNSITRAENEKLRQDLARYQSGEAKPGEAPAPPELSQEDRNVWQAREARHWADLEKARKEDPDFEDIVKATGKLPNNPAMHFHILKQDNSWEIVKYLAKHPETTKEWMYLPFGEASEKITKLSGKLEAAAERQAEREDLADKIASKIPKPDPIKPLNGGARSGPRPLREMSQAEFKAARAKGYTKW